MYFKVFVLENEPQYKIHNHFHLKNKQTGEFFQFSYDNEFRRLIRMMAGVNIDLRTTLPPWCKNSIKEVLSELIHGGIFPTCNGSYENLRKFCRMSERFNDFLDVMAEEICR